MNFSRIYEGFSGNNYHVEAVTCRNNPFAVQFTHTSFGFNFVLLQRMMVPLDVECQDISFRFVSLLLLPDRRFYD